jgi:hypothetical protein
MDAHPDRASEITRTSTNQQISETAIDMTTNASEGNEEEFS